MIRLYAPPTTPQQALADALSGTILGPSTIELPDHRLVVAHPSGVVRVDGRAVGMWSDDVETLAEQVRRAAGVAS